MTYHSRVAAFLSGALLFAACAPVVTHGPRVEPGVRLHATFGTVRPLCDTGCANNVIPMWGGGIRYGFVPADPARPAFLAGLSVPIFDPASPEADLFVQGPGRNAATAYGAGVLSSPRHLMPYLQFGRTPERGLGWYVTPAYAWTFRYDRVDLEGGPDDEYHHAPRYWAPAATLRVPSGEGHLDLFVAGAFGHAIRNVYDYSAYPDDPPVTQVRQRVRTLLVGVTVSADPARLPSPRIPPPRLPGTTP